MQGHIVNKPAKLLIDLELDSGESRKIGDTITIVKDNEDGTFHAEDNDFACKVSREEFKYN